MNKQSIFKKKDIKSSKKSDHTALTTVIGPGNLLILLGITIFLISVIIFSMTVPINITSTMNAFVGYGEGNVDVLVKNDGILSEVMVSNGDYVQRGDLLGVLTTQDTANLILSGEILSEQEKRMIKRQTMIVALDNGVVFGLKHRDGAVLSKNTSFCHIARKEKEDTPVVIQAYSTYEKTINIKQGDKAIVALESLNSDEYGYLNGIVRSIQESDLPQEEGTDLEILVIIDPKLDDQGNYVWTKKDNGFTGEITDGEYGKATIFTDELYLIDLIVT